MEHLDQPNAYTVWVFFLSQIQMQESHMHPFLYPHKAQNSNTF